MVATRPQPVHTSARARRTSRPSRQQIVRNTAQPSSASPANPSERVSMNAVPTGPFTAPLSTAPVVARIAPLPTAKEYAPPIGWESADTTR